MPDVFDQAADIFDQAAAGGTPPTFAPRVPDPISGLEGEGDLSGLTVAAPPSTVSRIGERIKQNVELIPNAIDAVSRSMRGSAPTAKDKALQASADATSAMVGVPEFKRGDYVRGAAKAATFVPRLAYETAKGYAADPASLAGDVATGYIAHQVAPPAEPSAPAPAKAAPRSASAPVAPEPPLAPEQQAKFTADLDKANAEYADKSAQYHSKLSQLFDESKRQATEAAAKYDAASAEARAAHQSALDKAQADLADEIAKESKSHAEWQAKADAAKSSQALAAQTEAQRAAMTNQQQTLTEAVRQGAQKLYADQRAVLDKQWDAIRDKVGEDSPVPIQGIVDSANDAIKEHLRGSPGNLKQFKELLHEFGITEMVENEDGSLTSTPDATSSWKTLRIHSSALGRALSSGDLPGNVYHALKQVRNAVEDSLEGTAEARGVGKDYRAVKSGERAFQQDFESLGSVALGEGTPLARLVRAPSSTFAADAIHGKAGDILVKNLGKWDPSGQLAKSVEAVRQLRSQVRALPKVKAIPDPPPYEGKTPTLREVAPPEMPEKPSLPERKDIPAAPELRKVARPKAEAPPPPKAGKVARTAAKIAGKVVGGYVGAKTGHPLIGYGIGGEAGTQIADRIAARRAPKAPPPPEQ